MSEVNGPEKQVKMNYSGNSNKQKDSSIPEERIKIEKVITGEVIERKKGIGSKIRNHFQGENDMQSIGSYVFWDVIVPKFRDLAFDAVIESSKRAFYGDSRPSSSGRSSGATVRPTAYNRMYQQAAPEPRNLSQRARNTHEFNQEIILPTLGEAEKVLDTLLEYVEKYGFVSVMDLYDAVDITGGEFTDEKHGWDDLRTAKTSRIREGYLLNLPPTKQRE
jgi:hypothetical protein